MQATIEQITNEDKVALYLENWLKQKGHTLSSYTVRIVTHWITGLQNGYMTVFGMPVEILCCSESNLQLQLFEAYRDCVEALPEVF